MTWSATRFRWEGFDRPLRREFYSSGTVRVARALLGAWLVHRTSEGDRVARIVETEAYLQGDPASHAFGGETRRNRSMFCSPGTLYVFRIHQVCCANAVTATGEAVLLRAGEPASPQLSSASGPGRLCQALGVDLRHDRTSLISSEVRLLPGPRPAERVRRAPRVGISRARGRGLRFFLANNRFVSRPRRPG